MELQADARHFVTLYGTAQFRAAQSVVRGQYVARKPRIVVKIILKKADIEGRRDFPNL